MLSDFVKNLSLHIETGYPLIFIVTKEEERAITLAKEAAKNSGVAFSLPRSKGKILDLKNLINNEEQKSKIIILDDVHLRLNNPDIIRLLGDLDGIKGNVRGISIIAVVPWIELPVELERKCAVLDLPLPDSDELGCILNEICAQIRVIQTPSDSKRLVRAAQGLSREESVRAFRKAMLAWPENADEAFSMVAMEKKTAMRRSKVLQEVSKPVSIRDVGGLDRLKNWIDERKTAFSQKASEFGLSAPRGILLMGIQGCGKSLTAKTISSSLNLPLVRLDIPSVFGADSPEYALKTALDTVEAMAPSVLWIDEIEKGFQSQVSGSNSRLLAGLITWLQEKQKDVFVVATANNVHSLPPELPRKGRFDEIFFVDLPNLKERIEILKIHLIKRKKDPKEFSIETIANKTNNFTGSELEQLIISAMYSAFAKGKQLSDDYLYLAIKETVPMYEMYNDQIKAMREWARKRARPASTDIRKVDLFK